METTNVKEVKEAKNTAGMDKRTIYLITKPTVFPGETEPRSEIIRMKALDPQSYIKTYSAINASEPRRSKVVHLTGNRPFYDGRFFKDTEDLFNHLIRNRGYKVEA